MFLAILGMTSCMPGATRSAVAPFPNDTLVTDRALTDLAPAVTFADMLTRSGYVAVPFQWQYHLGGHQFLAAKIDTTAVSLLLDSGLGRDLSLVSRFGEAAGVQLTDVKSQVGYTVGVREASWAIVKRLAVGSATLEALEATMENSIPGGIDGIIGAPALNSHGAVIDFVTNTLYLLAASESPVPAAPAATTDNLRAALETAGQYRTFLTLMREAKLMPLLEGTARGDATPDSLAWLGLRTLAFHRASTGAMPMGTQRIQLTRDTVNRLFRRAGQLTLFAPTDSAFAQLPPTTLRALRADRAQLARMLRAHILTGVHLDTLAMRTFIRGVAQSDGSTFGFHGMGQRLDIDRLASREQGTVLARARIVQADLTALNGVVHGVDRVLIMPPPSPWAEALTREGYLAFPLFRYPNGWYMVQAKVNGVPVMLSVDTGCPHEVTLDPSVRDHLPSPSDPSGENKYSLTLDSATVIPVDIQPVNLSTNNQILQYQTIPRYDGLICSQLLTKYQARLDYTTGTLYLRFPAGRP